MGRGWGGGGGGRDAGWERAFLGSRVPVGRALSRPHPSSQSPGAEARCVWGPAPTYHARLLGSCLGAEVPLGGCCQLPPPGPGPGSFLPVLPTWTVSCQPLLVEQDSLSSPLATSRPVDHMRQWVSWASQGGLCSSTHGFCLGPRGVGCVLSGGASGGAAPFLGVGPLGCRMSCFPPSGCSAAGRGQKRAGVAAGRVGCLRLASAEQRSVLLGLCL